MVIPNFNLGPIDFATLIPYISMACVMGFVLGSVPLVVWLERVAIARTQDRLGPNRVGPLGLFQTVADGIKLFFKEDLEPSQVDRMVYYLAPMLVMIPALAAGATIPFHEIAIRMDDGTVKTLPMMVGQVNVGILFVLALASLQVYGLVLAGWSSNNKYSLIGGLRSSAQVISYELSMSLAILTGVFFSGSLELDKIVVSQAGGFWNWNCCKFFGLGAIATVIYLISMIAETNRAPFDLPEAESELIAGFHTEYSSMKFAMFFMGEYASMMVVSSVATALWFGGSNAPLPFLNFVPGFVWFVGKIVVFLLCYIWLRASLPRFRYDALMNLGWKKLLPTALAVLFLVAAVDTAMTKSTPVPQPVMRSPFAGGGTGGGMGGGGFGGGQGGGAPRDGGGFGGGQGGGAPRGGGGFGGGAPRGGGSPTTPSTSPAVTPLAPTGGEAPTSEANPQNEMPVAPASPSSGPNERSGGTR